MSSQEQARRPDSEDVDPTETTTADIVAEEIEAGYDIQADAAKQALVSDPASSSEDQIFEE